MLLFLDFEHDHSPPFTVTVHHLIYSSIWFCFVELFMDILFIEIFYSISVSLFAFVLVRKGLLNGNSNTKNGFSPPWQINTILFTHTQWYWLLNTEDYMLNGKNDCVRNSTTFRKSIFHASNVRYRFFQILCVVCFSKSKFWK